MPAIRFWALYATISRLDAAADLRALAVAGHGANPGKDGRGLRDYAAELGKRAGGGATPDAHGAPSVPASALRGPFVTTVEPGVVSGERARLEAQVKEQMTAWETGKWPALAEVLTKQQAENRASR